MILIFHKIRVSGIQNSLHKYLYNKCRYPENPSRICKNEMKSSISVSGDYLIQLPSYRYGNYIDTVPWSKQVYSEKIRDNHTRVNRNY